MVVTPEKNKDWDYVSPSAMKLFNMYKKITNFASLESDLQTAIDTCDPYLENGGPGCIKQLDPTITDLLLS